MTGVAGFVNMVLVVVSVLVLLLCALASLLHDLDVPACRYRSAGTDDSRPSP